jgi:hypothetical protein
MKEQKTIKIIDKIKYKYCSMCEQWKVYDIDFRTRPHRGKRIAQCRCKICENKRREIRRLKDPQKYKDRLRNLKLRQKFGINLTIYNEMLNNQNGLCFICGQNNNTKQMGVDHNHNTKEVRKLLCSNCNTGLGQLKENYEILLKCIWYLYIHENKLDITFDQFIKEKYLDKIIKN